MHLALRSASLLLALSWSTASHASTYTTDSYYLSAYLPSSLPYDSRWASASGISDSGQIVGSFHDDYGTQAGFLLHINGAVSTLRYPSMDYTTALGINNNGDVVGNYQLGFTWA
jgi:uncharacterized membrane protein